MRGAGVDWVRGSRVVLRVNPHVFTLNWGHVWCLPGTHGHARGYRVEHPTQLQGEARAQGDVGRVKKEVSQVGGVRRGGVRGGVDQGLECVASSQVLVAKGVEMGVR